MSELKFAGVDVFIVQKDLPIVEEAVGKFKLESIANRGSKVWPGVQVRGELVDVHQCRFMAANGQSLAHADALALLGALEARGLVWTHVEKLLLLGGKPGYSDIKSE